MPRHAMRKIPQMSRADVSAPDPVAVSSHYGVHVTNEAVEAGTVLCGRGGRGFGFAGRWRVLETRRGRAHQTRGVLGLDTGASTVCVGSSLPLPPEVPIVEHLFAVGIQGPVISFA